MYCVSLFFLMCGYGAMLHAFTGLRRRAIVHGIGWPEFQESVIHEFDQQLVEMVLQKLWCDVILRQKLLIGGIDIRRRRGELPHASSRFVEAKVFFRKQIQQHGFLVQEADEDV